MKNNKNNFFELYKFISILTLFCLFGFGVHILGQKTSGKKLETSKPKAIEKQNTNAQSVTYWSESRKSGEPRKLALLVGISDYSSGCKRGVGKTCWWELGGKTDVQELGKILSNPFFEFEVVELTDRQATKEGIKQAFKKLIELTKEGDIVYFHFSGHGCVIQDQPKPNDDEVDGIDETLVPFDYEYRENKEGLIIDDEINQWLDSLKNQKPLNVTVTFDSCYSGTATRGEVSRGGSCEVPNAKQKTRNPEKSPSGLVENNKNPNTGFVYISAADANELAKETDTSPKMGKFTLALIKTLNYATSKSNITYGDFFEKIKNLVTVTQKSQNPQLEGDRDLYLFGNTIKPGEKYFTIGTEGSNYIISAGKLNSVGIGSKLAIYEAGTKKAGEVGKRKLAEGEIKQTFLSKSVIKLDKQIAPNDLVNARAFETARKLDIEALQVVINNLPQIEKAIKTYEFAQVRPQLNNKERNFDLLFRKLNPKIDTDLSLKDGDIVMERNNGSIRVFSSNNKNLQNDIKEAIKNEAEWKGIKELENPNSDLQVEMRIKKVGTSPDGSINIATEEDPIFGKGGLELNLGDYYKLEVKNNSESPVSITVLALTDGKIEVGFPNQYSKENKIPNDGEWKFVSYYRANMPKNRDKLLPLEVDFFKLIATKEASDLSSQVSPDEKLLNGTRGPTEEETTAKRIPLGKFLGSLFSGTRSPDPLFAETESWTTASISYRIKCPIIDGKELCCVERTQKPWKPVECKK